MKPTHILLSLFITLISLLSSPALIVGQYAILDLSDASVTPSSSSEVTLPNRIVGIPSVGIGPPIPSQSWEIELIAPSERENVNGCQANPPKLKPSSKATLLMVMRGNCTFVTKARLAQSSGAAGLIVINDLSDEFQGQPFEMVGGNATEASDIVIPAFMISYDEGQSLLAASYGSNDPTDASSRSSPVPIIGVTLHLYDRSAFDPSFLVMLVIALATVMYGAYLGSYVERVANWNRRNVNRPIAPSTAQPIAGEEGVETQYLDQRQALGFIVMASLVLIILFFFIRYLIYILIFVFCFGALQAITHLGTVFLRWLIPSYTRTLHVPFFGQTSVYTIISFAVGLVLTVTWACIRNQPNGAWVLQDILGISLLLVLQQSLRLPDIKVSAILLSMAFLYDIFWVFLSGYFFQQSVMVTVAQGGGTGETVPMLLRLPRLDDEMGGYSMLGLGDIALPGLFISYLLRFDLQHRDLTRHWSTTYFVISSIGYGVGLLFTYLALMFSSHGQPALLYLVPTTLGVIIPIAWLRGDLKEMWSGPIEHPDAGQGLRSMNGTYSAVDVESSQPSLVDPTNPSSDHAEMEEEEFMGFEAHSTQLAQQDPYDNERQMTEDEKEMMDQL